MITNDTVQRVTHVLFSIILLRELSAALILTLLENLLLAW